MDCLDNKKLLKNGQFFMKKKETIDIEKMC